MSTTPVWMRHVGAAALSVAAMLGSGLAAAYTAPYSTPPGIILVDVVKLMDAGSPQFLWLRLGDAQGNPLYTYDADQSGRSSCYTECARQFAPYAADRHARGFGEWSIVGRDDHVRQWAYQGKPLYRYAGHDPVGEPQGARFQLMENPAWHDPASTVYSPKKGWRRAAYAPERSVVMPTSVELQELGAADGFGFVDPVTRMTIYAVPVSHKLTADWHPVRAADLAVPVGQFSLVTRKDDGSRQWTYRGEALYTYAGDYSPGDVNGIFAGDHSIQVALAYRNFLPSGVTIGSYVGRGPLMTTAKGQALYFVARYHATYGGRETPGGYTVAYNEIKSQGTVGCEGDCTNTWKPLLASARAQPSGFWELSARPDGSRQWAFKGGPVYTFVGDRKPGDIEGNNRYVIVYGGANGQIVYADAGTDPRDPKPMLGNISMAAAVGTKPGERGLYLAGAGYVGDPADRSDTPSRPAQAPNQHPAQAQGKAQGKGRGQAAGAARSPYGLFRFADAGAGFYWHTVPLP